jgi:hypothetical protein
MPSAIGVNPGYAAPAHVFGMARPWVGTRIVHQPCPYRVQVDVPDQRKKIGIGIDQDGVIPALKQVTGCLEALLEPTRVATCNPLYEFSEGRIRDLRQQVNVVGHPAVRVHAYTEVANRGGNDFVQKLPVFRRAKDVLPVITPEGHMVEAARMVQA